MAEKIGQILIREGKITPEQLQEALRTQEFFGGYLGGHLINLGYLDEASLCSVLSRMHGVPSTSFSELRSVRMEAASLLPAALAVKLKAVPLAVEGNRLRVAIVNPRDTTSLSEISAVTGLNVVPSIAPEFRIIQTIERLYRVRRKEKRGIVMRPAPSAGRSTRPAPPPTPVTSMSAQTSRTAIDSVPSDESAADPTPAFWDDRRSPATQSETLPRSLDEWHEVDTPKEPSEAGEDARAHAESRRPLEASGPPETIEQVIERVEAAADRGQVCRPLVQFTAGFFRRAVVLAQLSDRVRVLDYAGEISDSAGTLKLFSLPARLPNLFENLRDGRTFHLGPTSPLPGTRLFFSALGDDAPPSVLILPVAVRDRTVAFLYADNRSQEIGPVDLALWKKLSAIASVGLEIQLLRNKLRSL